jgi:hypothetical protein
VNGTTRVLKAATGHINANGISYCYWVSDAMIDKLGAIEQFIAGYFHQDWDLDGAEFLMRRLRIFFLQQVGCAYRYQADGYSGAEWLNSVV